MKLFYTITAMMIFAVVHGNSYIDEGPCSDQNLSGCDHGEPDSTSSCDTNTGEFFLHYDSCGKKCSVDCKEHPDDGNRHPACDDPIMRQDCRRFTDGCSKNCGIGSYTTTYRCWDTARTSFTCDEFCCCGKCSNTPRLWPIPTYRNCDGRQGPINDKVCSGVECSPDTLYFPEKNICLTKDVADNKMTWDDAQVYCSTLYPGGRPVHILTDSDMDLLMALYGYNARVWTDFYRDGTVIRSNWDQSIVTTDADAPWAAPQQPDYNGPCVNAGRLASGKRGWDDLNCNQNVLDVACEYDL